MLSSSYKGFLRQEMYFYSALNLHYKSLANFVW